MRFIMDLDRKKVVRLQPMGLYIGWGKAPIYAYQIYEAWMTDGKIFTVRGHTIRTQPGTEDLNKRSIYSMVTLREDLDVPMRAAFPLYEAISAAAYHADEMLKNGGKTKQRSVRKTSKGRSRVASKAAKNTRKRSRRNDR